MWSRNGRHWAFIDFIFTYLASDRTKRASQYTRVQFMWDHSVRLCNGMKQAGPSTWKTPFRSRKLIHKTHWVTGR